MKIEKVSSETTYRSETREHIINVNGKDVAVYQKFYYDNFGYNDDIDIDEKDKAQLTDDELDELEDSLADLIME